MLAHILQPYAQADWPLVASFKRRWPDATVHAGGFPSLRYRTKIGFLAQLPKLFFYGFRIGWQGLAGTKAPKAFIMSTDFEVLGVALAQLLRRKRVPIFLVGFIYTLRKQAWLTELRRLYFKWVLSLTDGVICHSTLETTRYAAIFGLPAKPFRVVPFSLNVERPQELHPAGPGYALSAGRAERDYGLLARAWQGTELDLRIVCDTEAPLRDVQASPRISTLRQCFGDEFLRQIAGAEFVVVPLKDPGLSAGQMVLLQSMAMGRPVIISRTPTTEEYGVHRETLYFVDYGSEAALREAVRELAGNAELRQRIGANARRHYEARHTVSAYTDGVLSAVEDMLAQPAQGVAAARSGGAAQRLSGPG